MGTSDLFGQTAFRRDGHVIAGPDTVQELCMSIRRPVNEDVPASMAG
jgi:hypothetical protein